MTQSSTSVLINGFGVLFVIFNSFGLGLRLPVGKLLAEASAHRKIAVWALVINFVIIPLLFIGYLLTIASSIPGEIKVGFCVAALSAGMPFAPLLARLAKADVSIATTLLVLLTAATIIALPLGLPLAIDAVDAQLKTSVWDVAWPLLLFLLLPLVLGCGFRIWWPDLTPPLARWVVRVAILCLLFNLNFTLVAYWNQFVQTWGTESYIAALAGPFIGLGCGYLLVSSLRVKDVGIRHATEVTTAVRNISPMLLMMIFPFAGDPLVTVSITILNTIGIVTVLLFVLTVEARCFTIGHPRNNQPASKRKPAPANSDMTSDPPVVADLPDEGEFFLVPVGANPPPHVVIVAPFETPHSGFASHAHRHERVSGTWSQPIFIGDTPSRSAVVRLIRGHCKGPGTPSAANEDVSTWSA